MMTKQTDVLIIGAGISGLMAAGLIERAGYRVIVLDKAARPGGRMATRPVGNGWADHGAQFFTTREPEFGKLINRWQGEGIVFRWSHGWSDGSVQMSHPEGHARYAVQGGMNQLPAHLAEGLDVRLNAQAAAVVLHADGNGWQVRLLDGTTFEAPALLMTPPVPQSLALLDAGTVALNRHDRAALEDITYDPCLAALYHIDGQVHLPEPGALQRRQEPAYWMADNQRKGISPEACIITIQASPTYSSIHYDAPDQHVLDDLLQTLHPFMAEDATVKASILKRWRYALPLRPHENRFLVAENLPPLAFAGDGFASARVEGAAMSGMWAARALLSALTATR